MVGYDTSSGMEVAPSLYRPMAGLSHFLEFQLFGSSPIGFHLIGNLFHALNVVLLYGLARRIFSGWIPVVVALIFASHPLAIESVTWATERQYTLLTLASLGWAHLALSFYREKGGYLFGVASLFVALGGIFSSLGFLFVPLGVLLCLGLVEQGGISRPKKTAFLALSTYAVSWLALWWRGHVAAESLPGVEPIQAATNGLALVGRFLYLFFNPCDSDFLALFGSNDFDFLVHGLGGVAVIGGVSGVIWLFRRRPISLLGLVFLVFPLCPLSVAVHRHGFLSERFFYLPLAGFSLLIGAFLYRFWRSRRFRLSPRVVRTVSLLGALWFVILAGTTIVRNQDWQDEPTLYAASMVRDPQSWAPHFFMGLHHRRKGRSEAERRSYERALKIDPRQKVVLSQLAVLHLESARWREASTILQKLHRDDPTHPTTLFHIGVLHEIAGEREAAVDWYEKALHQNPKDPRFHQALTRLGIRSNSPAFGPD